MNLEIDSLIEENGLSDHHLIVYTDGSVQRGVKSGWGYIASLRDKFVKEDSGFDAMTSSSMCMEVYGTLRTSVKLSLLKKTDY